MSNLEAIKTLRDQTGISIGECRLALEKAEGDLDGALAVLRSRGAGLARKRSGRALGAGVVRAYVHHGSQIGVLVQLLCETDFVAKNPEFISAADDLAMHIAAFSPEDKENLALQPYLKDPTLTVTDVVTQLIQKFGEKIEIGHFARVAIEK